MYEEFDDVPSMSESTGGYELPSIDVHDAVIAELKYDGEKPNIYKPGKMRRQGILVFQLDERNEEEGQYKGKRKEIRLYFTWAWGSKEKPSKIRELLEAWRGKPFTEDELAKYGAPKELAALLAGKSCRVNVIHKKGQDNNMRARVAGIIKAKNPMQPEDYVPIAQRKKKDDQGTAATPSAAPSGGGFDPLPDDDDIPF
jgi:hypothetical protein